MCACVRLLDQDALTDAGILLINVGVIATALFLGKKDLDGRAELLEEVAIELGEKRPPKEDATEAAGATPIIKQLADFAGLTLKSQVVNALVSPCAASLQDAPMDCKQGNCKRCACGLQRWWSGHWQRMQQWQRTLQAFRRADKN